MHYVGERVPACLIASFHSVEPGIANPEHVPISVQTVNIRVAIYNIETELAMGYSSQLTLKARNHNSPTLRRIRQRAVPEVQYLSS